MTSTFFLLAGGLLMLPFLKRRNPVERQTSTLQWVILIVAITIFALVIAWLK
jgi:hypothetical protein